MARGPTRGLAASNLACPQGVSGGRVRLLTAFMPGTPGTSPSGYCIHTPERSCESGPLGVSDAVGPAGAAACPFGTLCAKSPAAKTRAIAATEAPIKFFVLRIASRSFIADVYLDAGATPAGFRTVSSYDLSSSGMQNHSAISQPGSSL